MKKAAHPRALIPGMEPPDFLCRFDLVINLFCAELELALFGDIKMPETIENRAIMHDFSICSNLQNCNLPILPSVSFVVRTPRTACARPHPRRSAPKSRFLG